MTFGGIQKLTLLDYPEKTACTLFTIGCNFRCPYCQNAGLLDESDCERAHTISASEVLSFLKTRQKLLDGVCISGGEPLMQNTLEAFISEVKKLGFLVKIDTNGSYPQKLAELISSGNIDYVSLDIKNAPEKYADAIGRTEYDTAPILESMKILRTSSTDYEYRTTVVREFHTEDDLVSIAKWIRKDTNSPPETLPQPESSLTPTECHEKYFLQGFVNSENVLQKGLTAYTAEEMQYFLTAVRAVMPMAELRGV